MYAPGYRLAANVTESERSDMRRSFLSTLITLAVQFVLGMAVNLFVDIPVDHPGAHPAEYFSGVAGNVVWAFFHGPSILLTLHAVVGLVLVLGGLGLVVRAIRTRDRGMIITSVIAALAILFAGFNGGSFLNYHQDFSSMLMASFFAVAAIALDVGLFLTARPAQPSA